VAAAVEITKALQVAVAVAAQAAIEQLQDYL
jgi:hypothetical protein